MPPAAWGPYPASKAEAERLLLALHRDRGLGARIVRFAFVYGEATPTWPSRSGGPGSGPGTAVELHALNGVPFPDHPAGDADLWHGIVDTTRIRRELGFRPYFPSVWSARDAGAL